MVVLHWGQFCPLGDVCGRLDIFLMVQTPVGVVLASRGRPGVLLNTLQSTRQPFSAKDFGLNCQSVKGEKPCYIGDDLAN